MELHTIEETTTYLEEKFSSTACIAKAIPLTAFGPVMKFQIEWTTGLGHRATDQDGPMWVSPTGYTAAVPFKAQA